MKLVGEDHSRAKVVLELAAAAALGATAHKINQVKKEGDRIEHTSYWEASKLVFVDIVRAVGEKTTRIGAEVEFDEAGHASVVSDIESPGGVTPVEVDDLEAITWSSADS